MSDSNIPLLTDVVEDPDEDSAAREQEVIDGIEDIVVFEADDSLADTNNHFIPSAWTLRDVAADDGTDASNSPEPEHPRPIDSVEISDFENVVAELQTRIASSTYELTDELLRSAFSDIEAKIFRQISTHLRQQLPELIDSVVREHLLDRNKQSED